MWDRLRDKVVVWILLIVIVIQTMPSMVLMRVLGNNGWGTISDVQAGGLTGSPLLDATFNVEEWHHEELVIMGIFLSNFVAPFADSYYSAFSSTADYGSRGTAFNALQFSTGAEGSVEEILKFMVEFAVTNAERNLRPINFKYASEFGVLVDGDGGAGLSTGGDVSSLGGVGSETPESETPVIEPPVSEPDFRAPEDIGEETVSDKAERRQATLGDFLTVPTDFTDKLPDGGRGPTGNIWEGRIFYIDESGEGLAPRVIFDHTSSWDIQMMSLQFLRAYTSDLELHRTGAKGFLARGLWDAVTGDNITDSLFSTDLDLDALLFFDTFGNIVAQVDDRIIMVFPSASNQHITVTPTYNMLTSTFLGAAYANIGVERLLDTPVQTREKYVTYKSVVYGVSSQILKYGALLVAPSIVEPVLFMSKGAKSAYGTAFSGMGYSEDALSLTAFSTATVQGREEHTLPLNTFMLTFDFSMLDGHLYGMGVGDYNRGAGDIPWGQAFYRFLQSSVGDSGNLIGPSINIVFPTAFTVSDSQFERVARASSLNIAGGMFTFHEIFQHRSDPLDPWIPILHEIPFQGGTRRMSIFGNPVGTSASVVDDSRTRHLRNEGRGSQYREDNVARRFMRYLTLWSRGNIEGFEFVRNSQNINTFLQTLGSPAHATNALIYQHESSDVYFGMQGLRAGGGNVGVSPVFAEFILRSGWQAEGVGTNNLISSDINDLEGSSGRRGITPTKHNEQFFTGGTGVSAWPGNWNWGGQNNTLGASFNSVFERPLLVLPPSVALTQVAEVMKLDPDAMFVEVTPWVYLAYTEWFGLGGKFGKHALDLTLFPVENFVVSISEFRNLFVSREDMFNIIMQRTYMMLSPSHWWRDTLANQDLGSFWVRSYNAIVWAGTGAQGISLGKGGTTLARQAAGSGSSGFLSVDPLQDNFFTSGILRLYTQIALVVMGIGIIMAVVIGVLKGMGLKWTGLGIILVVQVVILLPTVGDIAPNVTNAMLQRIFKDRLNYWTVMESAENSRLMHDRVLVDDLGRDISREVMSLVNIAQVNHLDRSLMIRQDMSRKVTGASLGNLNELLQWRSTQWILPSILRMYSAEEVNANYIYTPMGDLLQAGNDLWAFLRPDSINPADYMIHSDGGFHSDNSWVKEGVDFWDGYAEGDTRYIAKEGIINNVLFYGKREVRDDGTYSLEREITPLESVRNFYMLGGMRFPAIDFTDMSTSEGKVGIDAQVALAVGDASVLNETAGQSLVESIRDRGRTVESIAGTYDNWDPASVQEDFGYLWLTETSFPLFYVHTREIFNNGIPLNTFDALGTTVGRDLSVERIITSLVGTYDLREMIPVRQNFMYHEDTGNVTDFINIRDMFWNVLPYMHTVQILTGGTDGVSGVLGDGFISHYNIYRGQRLSWLFRSNWVTKLMEGGVWTKPETVSGIFISNPMEPRSYPEERPMIFSDAERVLLGMSVGDLTSVELAILEFNSQLEREWTLFINYNGIDGLTPTVMHQHMAMRAMFIFNGIFSTERLLGQDIVLYPQQVGLRHVSFDALMRIAILNATNDSSLLKGNVVENMLRNVDFLTAGMLLVSAWISIYALPLVRNILMAVLFIFGLWGAARNVMSSDRQGKWALLLAYFTNILIFLIYTGAYFIGLSFTLGSGVPNALLLTDTLTVQIHSPIMIIFFIFLISIGYFICAVRHLRFIWKRRGDLGAGAMVMGMQKAMSKFSGGISAGMAGMAGMAGLASGFKGGADRRGSRSDTTRTAHNSRQEIVGRNTNAGDTKGKDERKVKGAGKIETSKRSIETHRVSRTDDIFSKRVESTVSSSSNMLQVDEGCKKVSRDSDRNALGLGGASDEGLSASADQRVSGRLNDK
jgi:hypothetical protein